MACHPYRLIAFCPFYVPLLLFSSLLLSPCVNFPSLPIVSSLLFTPYLPCHLSFLLFCLLGYLKYRPLCSISVLSLWLSPWALWTDMADYTAVSSHLPLDWSLKSSAAVFEFTLSLTLTQSLCLHHYAMFLPTLTYPTAYTALGTKATKQEVKMKRMLRVQTAREFVWKNRPNRKGTFVFLVYHTLIRVECHTVWLERYPQQ